MAKTVKTTKKAQEVQKNNYKGEKIKFGPYEWQLLERKGNTSLITTIAMIEAGPYHAGKKAVTWENCDLRKYLNGKFMEKFSSAEKAKIVEVTNQNPGNPWYTTRAIFTKQSGDGTDEVKSGNPLTGAPTKDKIFVLSIEVACSYFGNSTARLKNKGFTQNGRQLKPDDPKNLSLTFFVRINDDNDKNRIADNLTAKKSIGWWLRSPGEEAIRAALVTANGGIWIGGTPFWDSLGIRPALWVNL